MEIKKMNQEQIEKLAVVHMVEFFEKDSRFQTMFPTNEKSPGYDGNLNIYDNKQGDQRKKKNILYTFNTQIKGSTKKIKKHKSDKMKFKIEKDDLLFYKNTYGNCLFFYVVIQQNNNKINYTPYFRFFSRQDILEEISNMGDRKTKSLPFTKMPLSIEEFNIFLKNYKNDLNQTDVNKKVFETINNDKKKYPLSRKIYLQKDGYDKLIGEELTVYADYCSIPVPVGKMKLSEDLFKENIKFTIKIGDYPDIVIKSHSKITRFYEGLEITKSLRIRVYVTEMENIEVKLEFKMNTEEDMKSLKRSLEYFSRIILDKGFILNNIFIKYHFEKSKEVEQILSLKSSHEDLLEAMELFYMNMDEKLGDIKEEQVNQVLNLLKIKKGIVKNKSNEILHLKFGEFVYYFILSDNEVYNLFDEKISSKFAFSVVYGEERVLYNSPFFLADEDISTIFNFDIKKVEREILEIIESETAGSVMNQYELVLLRNYDKDKTTWILELAKFINNLLIEKNPNDDIEIINKFQIDYRMKEKLKLKDLGVLEDIISNSLDREIKFAAKLLVNLHVNEYNLDNEFSLLSTKEQTNFKNYPIYNLWDKNN